MGTHIGGSTAHIAAALRAQSGTGSPKPRLTTVDIQDVNDPVARPWEGFGSTLAPAEIVRKVSADTVKVLALADAKKRLLEVGAEPAPNAPDAFTAFVNKEQASDLVALTRDLIRLPTVNPPGALYRDICDYLERRLTKHGFSTEILRAEGARGDSDKYPRWNIIARREGKTPGDYAREAGLAEIAKLLAIPESEAAVVTR